MRESQCCKVADSNPTRKRVFTNSRLISTFLFHLIELLSGPFLASVFSVSGSLELKVTTTRGTARF